jgi:hypothetical protein
MSSEAQLVLDVWEVVRDNVPHTKRGTVAQDILYAFLEYGFEAADCASIVDEDPDLASAYDEVFADDDDDEEGEV